MTKNNRPGAPSKAHASRVRLFQILCALEPADRTLTQLEIESRLEELFAVPEMTRTEAKEAAGAKQDGDPEDSVRQVGFAEFRESCAAAVAVRSRQDEIDALIGKHSTGWALKRMSLVDRTLIRLAIYEGLIAKSVPAAVAISEAVVIAREFGSDESPKFVNGVLAKIARAVPAE